VNHTIVLPQSILPMVNLIAIVARKFLSPVIRSTFLTLLVPSEIAVNIFTGKSRKAVGINKNLVRLTLGL